MSATVISNLWAPPVWIRASNEGMDKFPSLINSGSVVRTMEAGKIATGPGSSATMNFFKDVTETDDVIQVEGSAPTINNLTSGDMAVPILNRVTPFGATALSAQVSGEDPIAEIGRIIGATRAKQRDRTILAVLRGIMGTGTTAANHASGCCRAMRVDNFDESGVGAGTTQLMSVDMFIDAKSLLGELQDQLRFGAMFIHSTVKAALEKADVTAFKEVSRGPYTITTYRDVPIVVNDRLVRAGTSDGYVYETFLLTNGCIAYGEKPQAGDVMDVASMQFDLVKSTNTGTVYDRTRFVVHPNGVKWGGTPSGQSATNAELQTVGNWTLALTSAQRCGIVVIRTNG